MTDFMSLVKETECSFRKYVSEYKGQHLLVYGGGHKARCIISYLKANNISDFSVCVDKKYFESGKMLDGVAVECIETSLKFIGGSRFGFLGSQLYNEG